MANPLYGTFALPIPEIVHEKVTVLTRGVSGSDATSLATIVNPEADDVAVIKVVLDDQSATVAQIVAYQYDGSTWQPLGGKLDADNVIIDEDLIMAGNYSQLGNLVKNTTGTRTLDTKGMSVADLLKEILYKEVQPSIEAQPSVSDLSIDKEGLYEVGTSVDDIDLTGGVFDEGAYTFDNTTGCVPSYEVYRVVNGTETEIGTECPNGTTDSTGTGSALADGDEVYYKVTASYTAGNVAKTNIGNDSNPQVKIAAGSVTKNSGKIKAYRKFFTGSLASVQTVDSTLIRSLTGSTEAFNGEANVSVAANSKLIVIAYPATFADLTQIIDNGAMGANILSAFTKTTVNVEGANGATAASYKVYTYEPAAGVANATTYVAKV